MSEAPLHRRGLFEDLRLQDYLTLGYLYLLALGILSTSVYYGLVGIEILSYSSLLDVLLTPLTTLESTPALALVMACIPLAAFVVARAIAYRLDRVAADPKRLAAMGEEALRLARHRLRVVPLLWVVCGVFSGYVGFAVGAGSKLAAAMADARTQPDHELRFASGAVDSVRVVGTTTEFVFYIRPGATAVTVTPLKEHVLAVTALRD
jgi:hypothetical protein